MEKHFGASWNEPSTLKAIIEDFEENTRLANQKNTDEIIPANYCQSSLDFLNGVFNTCLVKFFILAFVIYWYIRIY